MDRPKSYTTNKLQKSFLHFHKTNTHTLKNNYIFANFINSLRNPPLCTLTDGCLLLLFGTAMLPLLPDIKLPPASNVNGALFAIAFNIVALRENPGIITPPFINLSLAVTLLVVP